MGPVVGELDGKDEDEVIGGAAGGAVVIGTGPSSSAPQTEHV